MPFFYDLLCYNQNIGKPWYCQPEIGHVPYLWNTLPAILLSLDAMSNSQLPPRVRGAFAKDFRDDFPYAAGQQGDPGGRIRMDTHNNYNSGCDDTHEYDTNLNKG